ncbi:MarR family winged helix-turn-helix transcriptional regulator [Nocardioidaceae bacterium SCSIO 66511]|nr:MarR family winged helix-turn-helix transcriptional regulator [Nocardioidaceae bacterium SCSIO 66511]
MALDRVAGLPTWLLSRANARSQTILGDAFAEAGVRGYHYRLLAALAQYGALSQAELGRRTGIDRKDVAIAVAELDSDQLIARTPDPDDARRKVVSLTAAGSRCLRKLDGVLGRVQSDVLSPLTVGEQTTLTRLLTKLVNNADEAHN